MDWLDGQRPGNDILGRSMWIDISKWEKDMKIFVSHVNAHEKVTAAEEFNNHMDKMTHLVDSQSLSSAIPVLAQLSGHGGRDGGYAWAQQRGFLLTKAELVIAAAEC